MSRELLGLTTQDQWIKPIFSTALRSLVDSVPAILLHDLSCSDVMCMPTGRLWILGTCALRLTGFFFVRVAAATMRMNGKKNKELCGEMTEKKIRP